MVQLTWETASDWDTAQSESGVEHSATDGRDDTTIRLGGIEDDGDVGELDTSDVAGTYTSNSSNAHVGPYCRHFSSGGTATDYEVVNHNFSAEISPAETEYWLYIPNPGSGNWVLKTGELTSGSLITDVAFDGANAGGIALLDPSSGWVNAGSYPANTWFKVRLVWDWANDQYDFYADGTQRVTGHGFRTAASGYDQFKEQWDYDVGGVDGYIDGVVPHYIGSGSLTTAPKTS